MTTDAELIGFMYEALQSDYGIYLTTDSPEKLRMRMYKLRQNEVDESLEAISFVISPVDPRQLWLVKRVNGHAQG